MFNKKKNKKEQSQNEFKPLSAFMKKDKEKPVSVMKTVPPPSVSFFPANDYYGEQNYGENMPYDGAVYTNELSGDYSGTDYEQGSAVPEFQDEAIPMEENTVYTAEEEAAEQSQEKLLNIPEKTEALWEETKRKPVKAIVRKRKKTEPKESEASAAAEEVRPGLSEAIENAAKAVRQDREQMNMPYRQEAKQERTEENCTKARIIILTAVFAALSLMLLVGGHSESEKQCPEFTFESWLSGDYAEGVQEWYEDKAVNRDSVNFIRKELDEFFNWKES